MVRRLVLRRARRFEGRTVAPLNPPTHQASHPRTFEPSNPRIMSDVLIVGAGPAGSVAAMLLARAGVRVRLVDRATFPRDKLCGDTLNPGSLSLLDEWGIGARIRRT